VSAPDREPFDGEADDTSLDLSVYRLMGHQEDVACAIGQAQQRSVGLESHGELVEVFSDVMIVVEVFDPVDFTVAVEVVQPGNLVPTGNMNDAIHDAQAKGLKQPGGNSSPANTAKVSVDVLHQPDISVPGAQRSGTAIGEKVETARPQPGVPRIVTQVRDGKATIVIRTSPGNIRWRQRMG
jgi:hypothetical protein